MKNENIKKSKQAKTKESSQAKTKESSQAKTKEIVIKILVDCDKDEFGNIINTQGFEDGKELQSIAELVGWLEIIQQQEIRRLFKTEGKKK